MPKTNWMLHVAQYRLKHPNLSLKDALVGASKTYKPSSRSESSTLPKTKPRLIRKKGRIVKPKVATAKQQIQGMGAANEKKKFYTQPVPIYKAKMDDVKF